MFTKVGVNDYSEVQYNALQSTDRINMCAARVTVFEVDSTGTIYMQVYSGFPRKVIYFFKEHRLEKLIY